MKIYYRDHVSSGSFVRVWLPTWAGDQFEVMRREDFNSMQNLTKELIFFEDLTDQNEDEDF